MGAASRIPFAVRWPGCLLVVLLAALPFGCARAPDREATSASTLQLATQRVRGFDPARVSDVPSVNALMRVYEGLLQFSYLDRPYRVEPLLADAMPEVSEDGLEVTIRMRRGIRFQDDPCFAESGGRGREVTARDFVYSVLRIADAKVSSSGWWAFRGRIAGLDAFRAASTEPAPTDYSRDVEGLRALDDQTVRIRLTEPYPQLFWVLAMHYAAIVPREAVEFYGERFAAHPVGTGPYVLTSWTRNYRMEFTRNPAWRAAGRLDRYPADGSPEDRAAGLLDSAGAELPLVDRIVSYVVADPATQWLMFLRGQLDESDISRDNWSVILGDDGALAPELAERGITMSVTPQLRITYIGLNLADPVFATNRLLRQALTCAFNSDEWVRLHNGRVRRATGPIPSLLPGYEADYNPFAFDLDRARALLAAAGYPGGRDPATGRRLELTLELGRADDLELRQSAELFVAFLDRIGVAVRLSLNNGPAFFEKLERKQAQMFLLSWLGDYPDAENFLQCFYGPNAVGGPNRANYANAEFDELFARVRTMRDEAERVAAYRRLARIVIDDCPWIFASEPLQYTLRQARVRNAKPHLFAAGVEKYYRLEDAR